MTLDPTLPISRCLFCGGPLGAKPKQHREHRYCSPACKTSHYNLKMRRGARIHDMLLHWRGSYKNRKSITDIGREVAVWLEEDEQRVSGEGSC